MAVFPQFLPKSSWFHHRLCGWLGIANGMVKTTAKIRPNKAAASWLEGLQVKYIICKFSFPKWFMQSIEINRYIYT